MPIIKNGTFFIVILLLSAVLRSSTKQQNLKTTSLNQKLLLHIELTPKIVTDKLAITSLMQLKSNLNPINHSGNKYFENSIIENVPLEKKIVNEYKFDK